MSTRISRRGMLRLIRLYNDDHIFRTPQCFQLCFEDLPPSTVKDTGIAHMFSKTTQYYNITLGK